ncbi:MAG: hypothetical protein DRI90_13700 [Deltaproteobacteria bacterium]|nr:MAG: hypothetical protein DRI90_13700 [Deltaproteobacteria bacterium]
MSVLSVQLWAAQDVWLSWRMQAAELPVQPVPSEPQVDGSVEAQSPSGWVLAVAKSQVPSAVPVLLRTQAWQVLVHG